MFSLFKLFFFKKKIFDNYTKKTHKVTKLVYTTDGKKTELFKRDSNDRCV